MVLTVVHVMHHVVCKLPGLFPEPQSLKCAQHKHLPSAAPLPICAIVSLSKSPSYGFGLKGP